MPDAGYLSTLRAFLTGRGGWHRPRRQAALRVRHHASHFGLESLEARVLLSADLAGAMQVVEPVPPQAVPATILVADQGQSNDAAAFTRVVGQFGTVPGKNSNVDLLMPDTKGTLVSFGLTGAGVGQLSQAEGHYDIRLTGTDAKSTLTIYTNGLESRTQIRHIQTDGPLNGVRAGTTDLRGTLHINGGVGTVALRNIFGGTINASAIGTIDVHGDLNGATVVIGAHPALGALHVHGSMLNSTVQVGAAHAGGLHHSGAPIESVRVDGTVNNSRFITPAPPVPVAASVILNKSLSVTPPPVAPVIKAGSTLDGHLISPWEKQMATYGRKHADAFKFLTGAEAGEATYYDAERVYYQIAEYTGDKSWIDAAQQVEKVYRDQYVLPNKGQVPAYWNFTKGLLMDYQRTGDALSKEALILLSRNAAFSQDGTPLEWTAGTESSREVAYSITGYLNAEAVGEARRARLGDLVTQAIGHLDQWFVSRTAPYLQPFMAGLTIEALIQYDRAVGGDPRIFPAIKTAVDSLWANNWLSGSEAFTYVDRVAPGVGEPWPAPDLNLLVAPAYAWMYVKTGDAGYQAKADAIFAGGVKFAYLEDAKQFNQNYLLAFDYLQRRNGHG